MLGTFARRIAFSVPKVRSLHASSLVAQKRTTGLVGLPVDPNARENYMKLLEKTLEEIKVIPEWAPYRHQVEAYTKYRLNVCRGPESDDFVEKEIEQGCLEELIEIQKGELELIPYYFDNKMWESREEFLARKEGTAESRESGFGGRLASVDEVKLTPRA